ncbi:hypothetical protein ROT00_18205 [Agromyces mediolanus]|uniref:hypothetical protein n=1 Tax=Agromyces mediolanus TaxID=41986 RepID=UPI0038339E60
MRVTSRTKLFVAALLAASQLMLPAPAAAATSTPPPQQAQYEVLLNGKRYSSDAATPFLAPTGCAKSDSETKHVVSYQRRRPNGVGVLLCGNSGFGWRHISARHGGDWQTIVTKYKLGGTWDKFAKWAMSGTLAQPLSARYNSGNDTYRYTAVLQIRSYNSAATTRSYTIVVPVGGQNNRIVTAYPVG